MRWRAQKPAIVGDRRLRRRFAWWPTRVRGLWVWLESFWVLEEVWNIPLPFDAGWGRGWIEQSRHLSKPELLREASE